MMSPGCVPDSQLQPFDQQQPVRQAGQPVMMGDALCCDGPPRSFIERLHQVLALRFQGLILAQGACEPFFGNGEALRCIVEGTGWRRALVSVSMHPIHRSAGKAGAGSGLIQARHVRCPYRT